MIYQRLALVNSLHQITGARDGTIAVPVGSRPVQAATGLGDVWVDLTYQYCIIFVRMEMGL